MTEKSPEEIYTKAIEAVRDLLAPTDDKVIDFVESTIADVLFQAEDSDKVGSLTHRLERKSIAGAYVTLTAAMVAVMDLLDSVFKEHAEQCDKDHEMVDGAFIEGFAVAIRGVASAGLAYADLGALDDATM